jgi:ABC-type branched-subunit amino acid transport system permease subunit
VREDGGLRGDGGLGLAGESGDELRWSVMDFEPRTGAEQEVYAQALTLVQDLDEYRALRSLEVREGIPSMLWVVLIVGGVITVCFTYLFGMRTPRLHVLMVVAFTLVLALVLYTIRALEYPFDGIAQVTPQAFELALDKIEAGGR